MKMLINVRGTSGSGKSTVVFELMKRYKTTPLDLDAKERPSNYQIDLPNGEKLFVIGRYSTQCGGCDGIGDNLEVMRRAEHYAKRGHVLFEGLLLSSTYGALGAWSEQYKKRMVFAFLDTPLETCLERVNARRRKRGVMEPVNPLNTTSKWNNCRGCARNIENNYGRTVVWLNHKQPVKQVLKLMGIEVRK